MRVLDELSQEEPTVLTSSAAGNAALHTTPTQQSAAAVASGRGSSNARGVRRLRSVVGSPYYVAPEVCSMLYM
jgi:hypothetical protein